MLRDSSVLVDGDGDKSGWASGEQIPYWQTVDRELRGIGKRRAALDAEEARWLREAERVHIWKRLGLVSMIDYLERALGYKPRTAQQRMQVARALEDLPVLADALSCGGLSFSAVRELARVATRSTEDEWCEAARGRSLRQIEELVAEHGRGSRPSDPPDPKLRTYEVTFERVSAENYAKFRQVRLILDEESKAQRKTEAASANKRGGVRHDDNEILGLLCDAILDGATPAGTKGRAKYQIVLTVCPRCNRGVQHGGGVAIPVSAATIEKAKRDAKYIERPPPPSTTENLSKALVDYINARDKGVCQVPGCRSALGLQIHHVVHREHGGSNDLDNLMLVCASCHQAHHEGCITISGTAPDQIVVTRRYDHIAPVGLGRDGPTTKPKLSPAIETQRGSESQLGSAHITASRFASAALQAQACDALVGLGWKSSIARVAVEEACAHVGGNASLEQLIFEALRRCPKPLLTR